MTQQEQDAILGRTRREYREAKNKFGALKKLNSEIADLARNLASALEQYPERLMIGNLPQGSLAQVMTDAKCVYTPEDADRLSPESLCTHLAEYIKVKELKARLRKELVEQGDDDPEA
jgi:hypothetical protein